jgi:Fe-S-cluster containining protein
MIRPYPQRDNDIKKAVEKFGLTPFDIAFLAKMQNEWCTKCGECCRQCTPINMSREEIETLACAVGLPYKKFKRKYRLTPRGNGTFDMPAAPCPFLKGNLCSVYHVRPLVCRFFPAGKAIAEAEMGWKKIEFPFYCNVVKKFFSYKIAALVLLYIVEREEPLLAEQVKSTVESLGAHLKTPRETMQFALAWMGVYM